MSFWVFYVKSIDWSVMYPYCFWIFNYQGIFFSSLIQEIRNVFNSGKEKYLINYFFSLVKVYYTVVDAHTRPFLLLEEVEVISSSGCGVLRSATTYVPCVGSRLTWSQCRLLVKDSLWLMYAAVHDLPRTFP